MTLRTLFLNWKVILLQGILVIALSLVIFNNPAIVLASLALWLGITVIFSGLVGVIAWFANAKEDRNIFILVGSVAMCMIGLLMISKMLITMMAISIIFGLFVALVGVVLIWGSWVGRKQWSIWWLITLTGVIALITGIKSVADMYSGAKNISLLIGIAVLFSGIGLVFLALLKKKIASHVRNKVADFTNKS